MTLNRRQQRPQRVGLCSAVYASSCDCAGQAAKVWLSEKKMSSLRFLRYLLFKFPFARISIQAGCLSDRLVLELVLVLDSLEDVFN
jgi:hypothetical protein